MKECSKSIPRRLTDSNFARKYFVGVGVDIGGKPDPLSLYQSLFPGLVSVRTWDKEDGDAQYLAGVADECLDFVHSSHCLEHLEDPATAIANWLRVLKPGGYLVLTVPDEDLYEQGTFPSTFNKDHKWTFTIAKVRSWSPRSINIVRLLDPFAEVAAIMKLELLHATYRFDLPRYDQTLTPIAECGIEVILRKRTHAEIEAGGQLPTGKSPPPAEHRRHLNQYRMDLATLKNSNRDTLPFTNEDDIA